MGKELVWEELNSETFLSKNVGQIFDKVPITYQKLPEENNKVVVIFPKELGLCDYNVLNCDLNEFYLLSHNVDESNCFQISLNNFDNIDLLNGIIKLNDNKFSMSVKNTNYLFLLSDCTIELLNIDFINNILNIKICYGMCTYTHENGNILNKLNLDNFNKNLNYKPNLDKLKVFLDENVNEDKEEYLNDKQCMKLMEDTPISQLYDINNELLCINVINKVIVDNKSLSKEQLYSLSKNKYIDCLKWYYDNYTNNVYINTYNFVKIFDEIYKNNE